MLLLYYLADAETAERRLSQSMDFLRSLGQPEEIYNLISYNVQGGAVKYVYLQSNTWSNVTLKTAKDIIFAGSLFDVTDQIPDSMSESLQTCYKHLNETGRTYGAIIQALEGEVRHACCIFYLLMRSADTVEDDITLSLETKIPILENFHTFLYQPDWKFTGSKHRDRQVLEDFPTISREFRNLAVVYQEAIVNAIHELALGMVEYLQKQVESVQDLDLYCHKISTSLVHGLSVIFSVTGLVDPIVGEDRRFFESLGLYIQKTNIIRDYVRDQLDGREFWPKEVWSKSVKTLSDFTKPENTVPAVQCLNELITNALQHIPDVLVYLSRLRNQSVFNFWAGPSVLAIATLATCYNNYQVFKGVVKIQKGQAVTLMMNVTDIQAVRVVTCQYVEEIYQKIPPTDPSSEQTRNILATIRNISMPNGTLGSRHNFIPT